AKGEVILRQGEPGDYYYLIKSGQCLLTRKPSQHAKEIKLALLRATDTFGEDALLSETARNVTITALSGVSLLRLSKENFISLIEEPTLKYIDYEQLRKDQANGAIVLDVRPTEEYNQKHLEGSVNTAFFTLRMQIKTMNRAKPIVVVCQDGKISKAAAFLLLRNKFKATILEGGLEEALPLVVNKEATFDIDDGVETTFSLSENSSEFLSSSLEEADAENEHFLALEIKSLKEENNELIENNNRLMQKCRELEAEKDEIVKQYRVLFKQTEKLKAVLDSLKKAPKG
ncbi:MAG: cyclic nucleotide-binding domain-containing protein, partial [Gammaproteobacteria bacterium]